MSQPPADAAQPAPVAVSLRDSTALLLVAVFSAILLGAVMILLPLPYAEVVTGPSTDTLSEHDGTALISIEGAKTYPTEGALDLTTVRIFGGPQAGITPWQMVSGWIDPGSAVVPQEALFPPQQTAQQAEEENRLEMASSQQSATAAALRALGYPIGEQVRVAGLTDASPSEGVLKTGDVIVSVAGVATPDADALRAELQKVTPSQPVQMVVQRDDERVTVRPRTSENPSGSTVLGILVEPRFTFPFDVKIQIDNVGGSSAGTMFALGIIDKLTPGSLTGGRRVAGTGTIDPDGNVGPIGFIVQKMLGARQSEATVFLAPRDNCDEVIGHIPDGLSVIAVSTLTQARDALEKISAGEGEAGLPRCS